MTYGTTPPPPGPGYGGPYAGGPYGPPPNHPRATTILVLGILGLAACGILGIPAWIMGNAALREIDASRGALGGRGQVQAGRICGIISTCFLALSVLFLIGLVVVLVIAGASTDSNGTF